VDKFRYLDIGSVPEFLRNYAMLILRDNYVYDRIGDSGEIDPWFRSYPTPCSAAKRPLCYWDNRTLGWSYYVTGIL